MQSFAEYLAESAELFFPFCVLVSKLQSLEGTLIELDFVQNYFFGYFRAVLILCTLKP